MQIVVAPDSYKGSVSALGVALAIERGVKQVVADASVHKVPIADGGEGTVEALITATGGEMLQETVTGPLGEAVQAHWGILGDGKTAVIEMAAASGLTLVPTDKRDPRVTTTYGTGQLIKAALNKGLRKLIIGIGGSATNDGGVGMAKALGIHFMDERGELLAEGGAALAKLRHIDLTGIDPRISQADILVACDVDNPLCGERGASAVYGPQKGGTPHMVKELDVALAVYARVAKAATGKDIANLPGAGAAGGLGAGLLFFTNAKLQPGVEIVIEATGLQELIRISDLVITGEGRTDFQTAFGKAPVGVAKIAKRFDIPVMCLSGSLGQGNEDVLQQGIDGLMSTVPYPASLEECMEKGSEFIESAAARMMRMVKIGMDIKGKG